MVGGGGAGFGGGVRGRAATGSAARATAEREGRTSHAPSIRPAKAVSPRPPGRQGHGSTGTPGSGGRHTAHRAALLRRAARSTAVPASIQLARPVERTHCADRARHARGRAPQTAAVRRRPDHLMISGSPGARRARGSDRRTADWLDPPRATSAENRRVPSRAALAHPRWPTGSDVVAAAARNADNPPEMNAPFRRTCHRRSSRHFSAPVLAVLRACPPRPVHRRAHAEEDGFSMPTPMISPVTATTRRDNSPPGSAAPRPGRRGRDRCTPASSCPAQTPCAIALGKRGPGHAEAGGQPACGARTGAS